MNLFTFLTFVGLLLSSCNSSSSSKTKPPADPSPEEIDEGVSDDETGTSDQGNGERSGEEIPVFPTGRTISRSQYLRNLGDSLAIRARAFQVQTEGIVGAANQYCASRSTDDLQKLRDQWEGAMREWQHFEVFQLGPVTENAKALKYNIYTWPDAANFCKIDEEALKASKDGN